MLHRTLTARSFLSNVLSMRFHPSRRSNTISYAQNTVSVLSGCISDLPLKTQAVASYYRFSRPACRKKPLFRHIHICSQLREYTLFSPNEANNFYRSCLPAGFINSVSARHGATALYLILADSPKNLTDPQKNTVTYVVCNALYIWNGTRIGLFVERRCIMLSPTISQQRKGVAIFVGLILVLVLTPVFADRNRSVNRSTAPSRQVSRPAPSRPAPVASRSTAPARIAPSRTRTPTPVRSPVSQSRTTVSRPPASVSGPSRSIQSRSSRSMHYRSVSPRMPASAHRSKSATLRRFGSQMSHPSRSSLASSPPQSRGTIPSSGRRTAPRLNYPSRSGHSVGSHITGSRITTSSRPRSSFSLRRSIAGPVYVSGASSSRASTVHSRMRPVTVRSSRSATAANRSVVSSSFRSGVESASGLASP